MTTEMLEAATTDDRLILIESRLSTIVSMISDLTDTVLILVNMAATNPLFRNSFVKARDAYMTAKKEAQNDDTTSNE